jgi:hypothetical protein
VSGQESSRSDKIPPHTHNAADGNLKLIKSQSEPLEDEIGIIVGFRDVRVYQCTLCGQTIEEIRSHSRIG